MGKSKCPESLRNLYRESRIHVEHTVWVQQRHGAWACWLAEIIPRMTQYGDPFVELFLGYLEKIYQVLFPEHLTHVCVRSLAGSWGTPHGVCTATSGWGTRLRLGHTARCMHSQSPFPLTRREADSSGPHSPSGTTWSQVTGRESNAPAVNAGAPS